jgi:hypothetical protein
VFNSLAGPGAGRRPRTALAIAQGAAPGEIAYPTSRLGMRDSQLARTLVHISYSGGFQATVES